MKQRLHLQKVIKYFLPIACFILAAMPIRAQLSEELVNSEYRDIILKQLKKSVEKRQSAMRVKAEDYLLANAPKVDVGVPKEKIVERRIVV